MDKIHAALKGVLFPKPVESNWEDAETRARRKREEGLARAEGVRREKEEKRRLKAEAEAVAATASREEKATEEV